MAARASTRFGHVDLLVNNARVRHAHVLFKDHDVADIERHGADEPASARSTRIKAVAARRCARAAAAGSSTSRRSRASSASRTSRAYSATQVRGPGSPEGLAYEFAPLRHPRHDRLSRALVRTEMFTAAVLAPHAPERATRTFIDAARLHSRGACARLRGPVRSDGAPRVTTWPTSCSADLARSLASPHHGEASGCSCCPTSRPDMRDDPPARSSARRPRSVSAGMPDLAVYAPTLAAERARVTCGRSTDDCTLQPSTCCVDAPGVRQRLLRSSVLRAEPRRRADLFLGSADGRTIPGFVFSQCHNHFHFETLRALPSCAQRRPRCRSSSGRSARSASRPANRSRCAVRARRAAATRRPCDGHGLVREHRRLPVQLHATRHPAGTRRHLRQLARLPVDRHDRRRARRVRSPGPPQHGQLLPESDY